MIRTLRKKFIAIAMLSLLGTMTVRCATIGIGNYCVAASRADKAIDILYQNDGEFPVPDGNASPSAHAGFQVTPETPFETRYFIARLTAEDAVSAVDLEHIAALDRQTVVSTIEQIVSKGTAKGYVGQYRFGRFENKTSGYTLIVVDCFMQLQSAYAVFRVMAAVFVLCAGIVFLLLLVLSKRATRPFAENWERQRQFVTDASHELKTPLAAIRLLTDSILQTENIDRETAREFVTDIGQEAERLSRITEDLLRLTRLDSGVLDPPARVDVLPVLEQVMRMMTLVAQERKAELTYDAAGECTVLATRDEIHQVIYNLTDNAVKYSGTGGIVQVSLRREGDWVVLSVADNGPGIPEEDINRVFERFYRVDKARSRSAGGTGLGLSIVSDTVKKRDGSVEAANRPGGGAVFTARWPWKGGEAQ